MVFYRQFEAEIKLKSPFRVAERTKSYFFLYTHLDQVIALSTRHVYLEHVTIELTYIDT